MDLFEMIGWAGAILFIMAYTLLSLRVFNDRSVVYHAMNALGGLCLVLNALHIHDSPTLAVNLVWMLIALFTVVRILIEVGRRKPS